MNLKSFSMNVEKSNMEMTETLNLFRLNFHGDVTSVTAGTILIAFETIVMDQCMYALGVKITGSTTNYEGYYTWR